MRDTERIIKWRKSSVEEMGELEKWIYSTRVVRGIINRVPLTSFWLLFSVVFNFIMSALGVSRALSFLLLPI